MINACVYDTSIKGFTLKALHAVPALLLQKPSKNSKSKNHLKLLEQFEILKEGNSRSAKIRWKFKRYSENIKDVQTSDA